jgi:hypothetical protein
MAEDISLSKEVPHLLRMGSVVTKDSQFSMFLSNMIIPAV